MKCKIEEVDGIKTRWLYEGEGPVFLMIHGVGGSGDMWYKNIDFFAEKYTVIAPDIVGHGFTQAVDFKGEPPQMVAVRHLNALMDHIGADKYCVAGSSYGALISSLMYFDRPDRVEKAVLIGSGSTFHPSEDQIKTLEGARANGSKAMQNPTWEVCQQRLGNICYDPATVLTETLLVQMTSYAQPDRLDAYLATIEGLMATADTHRVYDKLEQMDLPVQIITGRDDIRSNWEMTVVGQKRMPDARLEIYDKCGHLPMSEYADKFNQQVMEFLAG